MSHRPGSRSFIALLTAALLLPAGSLAGSAQSPSASPSASPGPATVATPAPSPSSLDGPLAGIEVLVRGTRDPAVAVPDEDLAAVVAGSTAFALDLYRTIAEQPGNLVVGPLSISTAMAMNHMGARGDTETQTAAGMHFDLPSDRLAAGFDRLARELAAIARPKLELSLVNQLFGQRDYPFEEPFLETLGRRFGAPMAVVDFGEAEAVRQLINAWVASQTNDRIKDLLPEASIDALTRLVLVNATYLKADWARPFNTALTEKRPFRLASGKRVRVPMMVDDHFGARVGSGDGWRSIELPYVGDRLAMLFIVPGDLAAFEAELTTEAYDAVVASLAEGTVALSLPRFSARTQVDLVPALRSLGIEDLFVPFVADLSGISTADPGLHVSAAVHQAFVKVAEKGTEAAAATAIGDSGTEGPPPAFAVDRPFLWFIRDRETGAILFLGRVSDPRDRAR
jgi:serpin B